MAQEYEIVVRIPLLFDNEFNLVRRSVVIMNGLCGGKEENKRELEASNRCQRLTQKKNKKTKKKSEKK